VATKKFEWTAFTKLEQIVMRSLAKQDSAISPFRLYVKTIMEFFEYVDLKTNFDYPLLDNFEDELERAKEDYCKSGKEDGFGLSVPVYRTVRSTADGLEKEGWVHSRKTTGKAHKVYYISEEVRQLILKSKL